MGRLRETLTIACAIFLAGWTAASAQIGTIGQRITLSGQTYSVANCPPVQPGRMRCFSRIVTDRTGRPTLNRFVPNAMENSARANIVPAGYGPSSLIKAYNPAALASYPALGSPTTVIAIVDAFGYVNAERDLQVYRNTYHLPVCTTANGCFIKLNQGGLASHYPAQDVNWAGETALDLDMASAMCPRCKIMLVESNNDFSNNLAAAVNTAVRKGAKVVSNSYGGPEGGPAQDFAASYHHPGVAITASTGDDGYLDHEAPPPHGANSPATSQYVTAVGGTTLRPSNTPRRWTESAWLDGGSGCSRFYPKPTWQASIPLCTKRMEADVSAVGNPETGVAVYGPDTLTHSSWGQFGGTSVGAPLIAGMYGAKGPPYTYGSLYAHGVSLNDVTVGHNGVCGGTFFCNAHAGYDGPTGLGTPTGVNGF